MWLNEEFSSATKYGAVWYLSLFEFYNKNCKMITKLEVDKKDMDIQIQKEKNVFHKYLDNILFC